VSDIQAESSFEVAAAPAEAWKALVGLRGYARGPDEWWLPGLECRGAEVEADPALRLTVRKLDEPCAGTLIDITFEHAGTGSRIRVVQSGFDEAFVNAAGPAFWLHAEHLFADLHLFFQTGVVARRAWLPWAPLGVNVEPKPYGLVVASVGSGTWAERIGLSRGDVVLTVGGAPLYEPGELGVIERIARPGQELAATWGHDGERVEGTATL
jgi:hypothetical protein